jgi:hypothetical protein
LLALLLKIIFKEEIPERVNSAQGRKLPDVIPTRRHFRTMSAELEFKP